MENRILIDMSMTAGMINTKACRFWWRGKCMLGNKKPCVHTLCQDWESKYIYPVRETWVKEEK